ncbi:hypothetical protein [Mycolicibacter kumamotonensis]|uniref:Uncharacterized protein n=1 Tax=Mycolicibacter kumamotonensis TaxID=354243 RepID=A0A7K3LH67_9MYCO|nr:hypothetical protein [Mycolicibacter kumamotonensis]NDJ91480.1 hypothetical protein [Mycolicibacter kumamotonensis]
MYDPQDDEVTREADAIGATEMAPTVTSAPGTGSVVDAFAWSQEDGSASAEPAPYVEDPYGYDQVPTTGRRPAVTPAPIPARRHPSQWPRYALGIGILVALIAVAGALYSLARSTEDEAPVQRETSAVVVPPVSSALPPPPAPVVPPPPAATTPAPPLSASALR